LKNNLMSNNLIHDIGELVGNPSGVYLMNCGNNEVSYSEIYNSTSYAIAWDVYPNIPNSDMYSGNNTFKYLNIYDCSQDSGDTAPIYAFCASGDSTPYLNSTLEQITVDDTYAHSSLTDYEPNGIFMDGTNGQVFKNIEITNTQWTAFRDNNAGNHTFNNVSWISGFSPSLMDYDTIGLKSDFPSEYGGLGCTPTPSPTPTTTPAGEIDVSNATASTSHNDYPASNAIDGSTLTRWNASSDTKPQWLKLDLGSVKTVNRTDVAFYDYTGRTYTYNVEVSQDDSNWTTVVSSKDQSGNRWDVDTFTATNARYIKINITACYPSTGWVAIYEAKVYNTSEGSTPTSTPTATPTPTPMNSFFDGFEDGMGNWSTGKGMVTTSTAKAHSGSYSYAVNEETDVIYKEFGTSYNKVATIWFYDDANDTSMSCMARVDEGSWDDSYSWRGIGVLTSTSTSHYVTRVGDTSAATSVSRSTG
jgi:hypothetical protein